MELVEWYVDHRPDKRMSRVMSMNPVLVMGQDMRLEITLNHEVGHLHEVILNQEVRGVTYLKSWKEGIIVISLPKDIKELFVLEVEVIWS